MCTYIAINVIHTPTKLVRIHGFITVSSRTTRFANSHGRLGRRVKAASERNALLCSAFAHAMRGTQLNEIYHAETERERQREREKGREKRTQRRRAHYADDARLLIFRALGILSTTVVNRFSVRFSAYLSTFFLYILLLSIHSATFYARLRCARSRKNVRFASRSSDSPAID